MTVILQFEPIWGTAVTVMALYGVPRKRLLELAKENTVRARKMKPESRTSTLVYKLCDVREWLDNEAPTPRAEAFEPRRFPDVLDRGFERDCHDTGNQNGDVVSSIS
jgi:hypothetical protein